MRIKGDQATARAMNRRLILNLLRKQGAMSRAALAAVSGLSPAAVTFVVADLLAEGLVHEGETVKGAGGRRPIPVSLNYGARWAIGMRLGAAGLEAVLTDLATQPLARITRALPDTSAQTVVAQAAALVRELVPDASERKARLVGIGLALPGTYDHARGICLRLARYGWEDVPVASMLAAQTDVPVWVDNDVNAFALAQHLFGSGQSHDNLLAFAVGAGVGAAFLTEGAIHRGTQGGAGEIGHITMDPDGPPCDCGRRGCFQAYWSDAALAQRYAGDLAQDAAAGAPEALALLHEAAFAIGRLLAQVNAVLDPDVVIFGGEAVRFGEVFRQKLEQVSHEMAFKSRPPVIFDWQADSWSRGAAALAAQHFFDFEVTSLGIEAERRPDLS